MLRIILATFVICYCTNAFASYAWFIDASGTAVKFDLVKNATVATKQLNASDLPTVAMGNNKSVATSATFAFFVSDRDHGRTINVFRKADLSPAARNIAVSTDESQEYPRMAPLADRLFFTTGEPVKDDDVVHGGYVTYQNLATVAPVNRVIDISKMTCIAADKSSFYEVDANRIEQVDKTMKTVATADVSSIWGAGDSNRGIEHCLDDKFLFVQYFKRTKEVFYYPYQLSTKRVLNKIKVVEQGLGMLLPNNRLLIVGTKRNKGNLTVYDLASGQKIGHLDLRAGFDRIGYMLNGIISEDGTKLFAVGRSRTSGKDAVISVDLVSCLVSSFH